MNCPYCNQPAEFVDNALIYGRRYGKSFMAYWCRACDARVGVHENDPKRPLGTMANKKLRAWRQKAHAAIDPIWQDGEMRRKAVYRWLSEKLGYEVHVAQSDVQQCAAIIAAIKELRESLDAEHYRVMHDDDGWADGHPDDFGDN